MTEADMVNHPPHYKPLDGVDFECIELARRLTFDVGNAVKYMWRTDRKNGRQDIEKARWYINDAITNSDAVFDSSWVQPYRAGIMLRDVAAVQGDARRAKFFEAIAASRLQDALAAIDNLLGDPA
jgi:hypothetical protein